MNLKLCFLFLSCCAMAIGVPDRQKRFVVDSILGKKCVIDDECGSNECCTPTLSLGNRCRSHMTEGTICSSFTEELVKRLHRRCPCQAGTSCKNTGTILGIYKINRCVKN